jgi:hypothetical protein
MDALKILKKFEKEGILMVKSIANIKSYKINFENEIKREIKNIERDPSSISSRGESKGELKKEVQKKIESLYRTLEAVKFYGIYEAKKKEKDIPGALSKCDQEKLDKYEEAKDNVIKSKELMPKGSGKELSKEDLLKSRYKKYRSMGVVG